MGDWELGRNAVYVIEITVALVLVLLLELRSVERLVVEPDARCVRFFVGGCTGGLGSVRAPSGRRRRIALGASELGRLACSLTTGLSVRADSPARDREYTLRFVDSIDLGTAGKAGVSGGAEGESLAHDGAAASLERQTSHGGDLGASCRQDDELKYAHRVCGTHLGRSM